ncbi:YD repeat protein OS=Isosphaera pallida (strain ATCC 43644 / DSM 9630 / IS1B) GN=Isop_2419 PE=4 SV=1: PT-HINT [Tuwongella immobilis]|uniref:Intein C-terminal splicing domain-containing protein n=1 Tax=Tuwongella immobilis TaxID=692036 RepID=A0A6C2YTX0_9BACT|nr:YD repeat protein OS=Isosphaera pallida (strain ATCC 43644 / DSM 9630 / IS1B) GN=Isop_2419 PE=4 SV=1: PT-HINT [Tuwongella immobilis]VTS06507.1 YD repeat protein OS=Isosphaera pallida (strain ATCC 43644 / DSM 9630 / IS1B) GN=Isop_2419 PE=4 SV=1: PT-HINT [Tuwongella immobilis]
MTIDTTGEHPFFEESLGWIEARSLTPGHRLRTLDGSAIAVEAVAETGQWQPVYNLRVADWHTYFVGSDEWEWAVWAHNAYDVDPVVNAAEQASVAARLRTLGVAHADELAALGGMPTTNGRALIDALNAGHVDPIYLTSRILTGPTGAFTNFSPAGATEVLVGGRRIVASPDAIEGMTLVPGGSGRGVLDPGTTEVVNLIERAFPGEVQKLNVVLRRAAGYDSTDLDIVTQHAILSLASGKAHLGNGITAATTHIVGTPFAGRTVIGVADGTVSSRLFGPPFRDAQGRIATNRPDQLLDMIARLRAGLPPV